MCNLINHGQWVRRERMENNFYLGNLLRGRRVCFTLASRRGEGWGGVFPLFPHQPELLAPLPCGLWERGRSGFGHREQSPHGCGSSGRHSGLLGWLILRRWGGHWEVWPLGIIGPLHVGLRSRRGECRGGRGEGGERVRVGGDGGWAGRVEGGRNGRFFTGIGIGPAVTASGTSNRRRKGENWYLVCMDGWASTACEITGLKENYS